MASGLPVASRTRARIKNEDSFAECFSKAEPGRRKGSSSGAKHRGRARQRVSSVSASSKLGGGNGGGASDDSHEVIVITDSEEGSDKVISVNGSGEEEEESSDYGPRTARRFQPNQVFHKCKNTVVIDDVSNDSDEEDSTDFEYDESVGGHENGRFRGYKFLSNACSDDDLICSGEQNSDEDFVTNVSVSLSADGETCSSSEEYVSGSKREENLQIRKKRKRKDGGELSSSYSTRKTSKKLDIECTVDPVIDHAGKKENVERRVSWVNEWLQDDVEQKGEEAINVELDIECMNEPVIDDVRRKVNVDCRVLWVNEWLQSDVEEIKEEEVIVERLNTEINCPSNDENGNSGPMEERGSFSVSECGGAREKEEKRRGIKNDGEELQGDDDEQEEEEGKAGIEFDGVKAGTDVSFVNEEGKIREMEERGNFCVPEKEGSNQSQEKSTSQSKVFGIDRRMQEKRYGKHVQSDFDSVVGYGTSLKVEGQKERELGMSCSIGHLQKKRKYEDCSGEKVFANRNAEKEQESATDGIVQGKRKLIRKFGEQASDIRSSAELLMSLTKVSETFSKPCKGADTNAANVTKKNSSVGSRCESKEEAVRNDCRGNWESRTRRERAGESRENTLFKLANCIWGKDEIIQDDRQKENAEKEKQFAGDCVMKEERRESTEEFETSGMTAGSMKRDSSDNMYEQKKVGEILTKSGEEGVGVHQAKGRKDNGSTHDYHIRWESSGTSKEFKYFKRLAQKFRDNKDDAGQKEIVWEIASRTEPRTEVPPLPLKFFWGDEEPEPPPKSEAEKEMDKMWIDMEFSLRAGEIGSSGTPEETETSQATLCPGGKHELICDEEIGLICLFCKQVQLEIKYVLPPFLPSFEKFSNEASGTKTLPNGGNLSLFEGVPLQPSGNESVELSHQSGSVLDLIPCDRSKMYPHQLEGFEFMWKNLAGSTDLKELSNSEPKDVGGCIISHAPGTGKTCLTILFLHTYLGLFPNSRPVIIAPASLLLTWEEEFRKWNKKWDTSISFHNLNNPEFSGAENPEAVRIVEENRHLKRCNDVMRMIKVYSWSKSSSILGISYNLYEKLAVGKGKGIKDPVKKAEIEKKDEEMRKILLDLPGVVVLDEGHTPRNDTSSIWNLLLKLRTEKRIILSGTPFQNNFLELYNTLCLVRPATANELPESLKKFCQTRTTQRKRAKKEDINSLVQPHDKVADDVIVNLRSIMAPFVHVHKGSILKENLPGIKECIVVLNPGDRQKKIVENIQRSQCGFEYEFKLSLACIHPSLILSCNAYGNEKPLIFQERQKLEDLKTNTDAGVKTRFLVELIRLSEALGEKVLVFSQYKEPLSLISDQLRSTFLWPSTGKEILHMHGSLDQRERQRLIEEFNSRQSRARVMLASTKACSEGISLVGASRVVLLDVVWNPSVERQAISRAFRIGQEKVVYTYHLITKGTVECNKYGKQMEKERLSKLVFSPTNKENGDRRKSSLIAEDRILKEMTSSKNFNDMLDQILYQPEDSDSDENFDSEVIP
ncbi:SNF2 domain-containing protein CLASSY 4-like [Syzygium oleosum]|uniref:SNF2 domain-containing protein CLASSY 4-like n=1 Tax=Syzygium oleosum TaxID=219896 RepID=UPI0024B9A0AD|nr:SNF2 domain-containing protein CLASSY 4-like [Syzygium oleosum]